MRSRNFPEKLRFGLAQKRGGFARPVLVFFHFLDRLLGRDDPFETVLFGHSAHDKRRVVRDQGQEGAHEIDRVQRRGLLRLATVEIFEHPSEARLPRSELHNSRIVALNEFRQPWALEVHRIADLHQGARRVFFRGIELREPGAENARLPVFSTSGNLLLFDAIFSDPDFGTILIRTISDDYQLENGIVRDEIEPMVELPHEGSELFEKGDADGIEIGLSLSGSCVHAALISTNAVKIAIDSNGFWVGRDTPFRSAEQDSDMRGVQVHHAGWNGTPLDGLLDGGKENDVPSDMNNDAATRQIGDDFVLVALRETGSAQETSEEHREN